MRSIFSGGNEIGLGGSGIVEGGFERSVSLAKWERQIGEVGGEIGFADVRGDLEPASTCGVELHLSLVGAWGGAEVRWVLCEECVEKCVSSHQI